MKNHGRNERAISAAYYAVHAAGKGILTGIGIDIGTHKALYKQLSYHFVKEGHLPDDTASRIQDLHSDRQAADYDLRQCEASEADASLEKAEALVRQIRELLAVN